MFHRIVIGAATTEAAARAIATGLELAAAVGAEVDLVVAFDDYRDRIEPLEKPATAEAEAFLEGLAADTSVVTHGHAQPGDPADAILAVAEAVDADLIVVGNKGMQGPARILGSVTNTVSHRAPCSVLIVSTT